MRRGADTNRTGSKGLARRGGTRKLRAKVCCTPPSNGAQTEIEWTATRVDAAFHMDRHRGSTPLGSIFTLACARWAELYGHLRALIPILVSRALVSRSPALAELVSRALVSRSPALAGLVLRAPARPDSDFGFTGACARWASFTGACAPTGFTLAFARSLVSRSLG